MEPVTLFDIAKTLLPDEVSPHDAIKEIKATMELRDGSEVSAIFSGTNAWSDAVSDFEFVQTSPLVASCVVTEIRLEGIRMKHQIHGIHFIRKEDTNMNHNHNHNQSQPMLTPREYAILLGWIYHNPNADQPRSFKIEVSNRYASTSKEIQTTVWVHDIQIGGKHFTPEELRKLTEPHEIDVAINSHKLEREKKEYERLKAKFTEQNTEGGYNHATSEDKE